MSISLRKDIASRVINPQEFIERAQKEAGEAVSLLEEKQTNAKEVTFKLDPNDSLDKKATTLITAMDELIENSSKEKPSAKKAEDEPKKLEEKSAAAKVIAFGIKDDAVRLELEKKANEKKEERTPISINLDALDVRALNEKVAISLSSLKKPVAAIIGGTTLLGAGYGVGSLKGKKNLEGYIAADKKRDQAVTQNAFRVGQMSVINQIKNALAARGAAN